jgi:hypothetical protein
VIAADLRNVENRISFRLERVHRSPSLRS